MGGPPRDCLYPARLERRALPCCGPASHSAAPMVWRHGRLLACRIACQLPVFTGSKSARKRNEIMITHHSKASAMQPALHTVSAGSSDSSTAARTHREGVNVRSPDYLPALAQTAYAAHGPARVLHGRRPLEGRVLGPRGPHPSLTRCSHPVSRLVPISNRLYLSSSPVLLWPLSCAGSMRRQSFAAARWMGKNSIIRASVCPERVLDGEICRQLDRRSTKYGTLALLHQLTGMGNLN